jgi:hypothetical protein
MSDQRPATPGGPNPPRNPLVTALMVLAGLIMLLPGLCSLIVTTWMLKSSGPYRLDSGTIGILSAWLAGLVIGAIGIGLIVRALRR